ncbi:MAG TPA: TIGR01777 family oxidoreductase [Gemmatimonadales bacterium]|nr:TIGR01777 family oxidoreductase [Gemmatimonadales bacterium]
MAPPFQVIERTSILPASAEEAFAWHERAGAFERLAPPWERLEIIERSGGIREGARTVVRVRVGPVRFRWVARHRDYEPGRRFVDEQVEGPFSRWIHEHRFEPAGPDASQYTDRIEFGPPFGALGAAAGPWVARPRAERMLAYRHATLRDDLAAHARFRDAGQLHVAVTGATGLLGSSLVPFLTAGGHRVTTVTRRRARGETIHWDPARGLIDQSAFEGIDAVVHLAGENVGGRWNAYRKQRIRESRTEGTMLLAEALAGLRRPPRVLVSASGMGIYGDRKDEVLTEDAVPEGPPGDFLAELGRDWEAASEPARAAGIRVVNLRFGLVLTPAGGALGRMLPPFLLGAGGPLGSGKQWVSWLSIDDAIGAMHHALLTEELSGPVNTASPEPVTSRTFAATLGRVLRRPALLPAPAPALKLLFGEMADTALLASQRLSPARLLASGYTFRHPRLEQALRHVLGRGEA